MDFLNRTYAQLADLFRSMTLGARITSGLLLIVVVVSLAYLFSAQTSGPDEDLMNGMPVPANYLPEMKAAFGKAGLTDFEIKGTQVLVPRGKQAVYMAALADADALPPNFGAALRPLQEALDKGGVFDSEKTRERRQQIATQELLSQIISYFPSVDRAYVTFGTDTKGGLRREQVKTAAATVKPLGNRQLSDKDVAKIRSLVAGTFAMKPEDVSVIDINGQVYVAPSENGGGPNDNLYVSLTKYWDEYYRTKISNVLSYIPNLRVEPTVVLEKERITRLQKTQLDPKTVPIDVTEKSGTKTVDNGGQGGRVGYPANAANAPASLAASRSSGTHEEQEDSQSAIRSLPSGSQEETEKLGLTPTRVTASIGIPSSYLEKLWREENATAAAAGGQQPQAPDKAALDRIFQNVSAEVRRCVAGLLPPAEGVADLQSLVTVIPFTAIPAEEPAPPTTSQQAVGWLGRHWGTLGLFVLVGFSLLMLRSMLRSKLPAAEAGGALLGLPQTRSGAERREGPEGSPRLRRFEGTGRSLRDELADLVEEDPDVAANILKSWIGHAG